MSNELTTTPDTVAVTKKTGGSMRLDDASIETITSIYPERVREAVKWCAVFCRERCNRNLDVLEGRAAALGHRTTATTFWKIFTGKYFIVADKGVQKGKFIGNVENFLQVVDALRRDDLLAEKAGRVAFIETETTRLLFSYIDTKRAPDQVCKFGMVCGFTGTQKSESFKEYVRRNNHGLCIHLESPHGGSMTNFITELAAKYGCSIWSNQENKMRQISESVTAKKTIIVDNVQRLCMRRRGAVDFTIFYFLQKLQDDTGCTIILSFTPEFQRTMLAGTYKDFFEQFIGRCGGQKEIVILDPCIPRDDILAICASFGLVDAEQHIEALEKITREPGRIRILFNALQKAKRLAGEEPLTMRHLREARDEEGAQ